MDRNKFDSARGKRFTDKKPKLKYKGNIVFGMKETLSTRVLVFYKPMLDIPPFLIVLIIHQPAVRESVYRAN